MIKIWTIRNCPRLSESETQFTPPTQTRRDRTVRKYSEHVQFQNYLFISLFHL